MKQAQIFFAEMTHLPAEVIQKLKKNSFAEILSFVFTLYSAP